MNSVLWKTGIITWDSYPLGNGQEKKPMSVMGMPAIKRYLMPVLPVPPALCAARIKWLSGMVALLALPGLRQVF